MKQLILKMLDEDGEWHKKVVCEMPFPKGFIRDKGQLWLVESVVVETGNTEIEVNVATKNLSDYQLSQQLGWKFVPNEG